MTSAAHLYRLIQDQNTGALLSGVSVQLCEPGTTTVIPEQIYADSALTLELPNPFVTANGIVDVYLAAPRNVAVQTTYGSAVTFADNIAVLFPAELMLTAPSPITLLNLPGSGTVLVGVDAASVQFDPVNQTYVAFQTALLAWVYAGAYALTSATRDTNGTVTSAAVSWPDGTPGTYTADVVSSAFPGKVDAYHVTYGNPEQYTFTQAQVTRDANGDIIAQPVVTVSS